MGNLIDLSLLNRAPGSITRYHLARAEARDVAEFGESPIVLYNVMKCLLNHEF